MRQKLMDQAEEKYRVSSEWAEPTSVASRRQFTPEVTQLKQKRVKKQQFFVMLSRFTSPPALQRLTENHAI